MSPKWLFRDTEETQIHTFFIMIQSGCLRDVEVRLSAINVKTCKIDNLQRIFSDPDFGDHSNLVLQLRKIHTYCQRQTGSKYSIIALKGALMSFIQRDERHLSENSKENQKQHKWQSIKRLVL